MRETVAFSTPWFDLLSRVEDVSPEPFYSLRMSDYVAVVAVTERGTVLLVRQFRSAVQKLTLELPAGHVDPGESPEQIGVLNPDTGRLSNRMWCYFAEVSRPSITAMCEADIEIIEATPEELLAMLGSGQFDHALHVAALLLCGFQGRLPFLRFNA